MSRKSNEKSKISKQSTQIKEKLEVTINPDPQPFQNPDFFKKLESMTKDLKGIHPKIDMITEKFTENMKTKENNLSHRILEQNSVNGYFEKLLENDLFDDTPHLQTPYLSIRKSTNQLTFEILEGQTELSDKKDNIINSCNKLEKELAILKKIEDRTIKQLNMTQNNQKCPNNLRKYILIESAMEFTDNEQFDDIAKVNLFKIFEYLAEIIYHRTQTNQNTLQVCSAV